MTTPPAPPATSFLAQIRHMLDALPPSERRLGEFILDFPGDLASYNASELAALVKVSNATMTRFIRRLGYDSYESARRHAREERSEGSPLFLDALRPGAPEGSIEAHVRLAQQNIASTFSHIAESTVDEIARAITKARSVWFLGYRSNRSFASYLRWQLAQLLPRTQVIPGAGETLGEYAIDMGDKDVLVVFALRRSPAVAAQFASSATAAGAKVLYVTDQLSRTHVNAQWVIRCHSAAPGPLDNHVALMLLCDLLATRVMEQAGTAGRKRLSGVEAAHERFAELRAEAAPRPPTD
jgi:DNA-binding MurR/RpiR family transcriptional regulator